MGRKIDKEWRVRPTFTQVQEQLDHVLFKMTPTDITTKE
nr:caffeoylshikimate esterase [Tanacetum cinerariifolium]